MEKPYDRPIFWGGAVKALVRVTLSDSFRSLAQLSNFSHLRNLRQIQCPEPRVVLCALYSADPIVFCQRPYCIMSTPLQFGALMLLRNEHLMILYEGPLLASTRKCVAAKHLPLKQTTHFIL